MINEPLTATEIEEGWENCPAIEGLEAFSKALLEPIMKRLEEILRKRGIKIPNEESH